MTKAVRFFLIVVIGLTVTFLSFSLWQKWQLSRRQATSLSIANLNTVEYEGGPVNSRPYQPGDDVYVSLDVLAMPLNAQQRTDAIVAIQPLDGQGKPMVPEVQITIQEETPEKHIPFHMTLPLYALGGKDSIMVSVEDHVQGQKASQSLTFNVDGPSIPAGSSLGVQDHIFVDREGGPALAEAVYHPGSMIRSRLYTVGFRQGNKNHVTLSVDLAVLGPSPQPLWEQPGVVNIDQDFFYPPQYVPITTAIFAPSDMQPGAYRLRYTLHDGVAGQTISLEEPFSLR